MAEQRQHTYGTPYKFNGKESDEETGLYYYGARYYDPKLSIWCGVDPLAEKYPDYSPYVYVLNNPVGLIDPTGMNAEPPVNGLEYYVDNTGAYYWNEQNNNYDKYQVQNGTEVKVGTYIAESYSEPVGDFSIDFDLHNDNESDKYDPEHTIQTLSGALMAYYASEKKPWKDISNQSKYPGVIILSHEDMNGAVTLGNMIFTNPGMDDRNTLDHEYGHYLDYKLHFKYDKGSYLSEIGLPSFISAIGSTLTDYNHDNSTVEKRANILGGAWSGNSNLYKK